VTIRNKTKYGILFICGISLLMIAVLGLPNIHSQEGSKLINDDEPLHGEFSSSYLILNHTELSNKSDTIVIGTVKEILPSKWNSVDGKKPSGKVQFSPQTFIYTDVLINVDEYVKNPLSSKEIIVRVEGGTVGNDTLVTDSQPTFQPGEKVLLYLIKGENPDANDKGAEHFRVTGSLQGKFTLTDDGKAKEYNGETISQEKLLSTIKE